MFRRRLVTIMIFFLNEKARMQGMWGDPLLTAPPSLLPLEHHAIH